MNAWRAGLLLICLWLPACHVQAPVQKAEYLVFGTLVNVELRGISEAEGQALLATLQQDFQRMHRDWHPWQPGALTELNQALARGERVTPPGDLMAMITAATELEQTSGGRFNATIGQLVSLWGFHTSDYPVEGPPPDITAIESLLAAAPSTSNLHEFQGQISSDNPALQFDFSGLAKGHAVDLALARIRAAGVPAALVNAGGDLGAYAGDGQPAWRVGIRGPGDSVLAGLEIREATTVFSSGVSERFRHDSQRRYPHILDPRTGWPSNNVVSATVVVPEGMRGDGLATALVVGGAEDFAGLVAGARLDRALLVTADDRLLITETLYHELVRPKLAGFEVRVLGADGQYRAVSAEQD